MWGGGGGVVALESLSKDLHFYVTDLLPRGYPQGRFLFLFLGSLGIFLFTSGKPGVCFYAYYLCSFYFGECRRLFISWSRRFPVTNLAFFKTSVTAIVLSRDVVTVSFSVKLCVQDGVQVPEAAVHVRFCYRINVGRFGSKSCEKGKKLARNPSSAFRHLPPNSEGVLCISAQLSIDAVGAVRKVWLLIRLWKQHDAQART